jgi:tRNA(adenine34) deaminase
MNAEHFMRLAIEQAKASGARSARSLAVLLIRGNDITRGGNSPVALHDPTAHAEILTLRAAGVALGNYRLDDTVLYVTLEPCLMCATAMVHARVRRVVFGAYDPKAGAAGGLIDAFALKGLNHRVDVFGGVLEKECGQLLSDFFAATRLGA